MNRHVYDFRDTVRRQLAKEKANGVETALPGGGGELAVVNGVTYAFLGQQAVNRPPYLRNERLDDRQMWVAHMGGLMIHGHPGSLTVVSELRDQDHLLEQIEFGENPDTGVPKVSRIRQLRGLDQHRLASNWVQSPHRLTEFIDRIPPLDREMLARVALATQVRELPESIPPPAAPVEFTEPRVSGMMS